MLCCLARRGQKTLKKLILFLVTIQLLISAGYGLLFFNGYIMSSVLNANTSSLMLVFYNQDEYTAFLRILGEEGLDAQRAVFIDDQNLVLYASDLSLDDRAILTSGRWPLEATTEFVSTIDTGEAGQVGTISHIVPRFNISIMRLDNTINRDIATGGVYAVNTTDRLVVENLVHRLNTYIEHVEIMSIDNPVNMFVGIDIIEIAEFVIISLLAFLVVIAVILNFAVKNFKAYSIYAIHGYSRPEIAKILTLDLLKILIASFVIAFTVLLIYMLVAGYSLYLTYLSLYFIILCITTFFIYILTINIFALIYIGIVNTVSILNAKKPYVFVQTINILLKLAFTVSVLAFGSLSLDNFVQLRGRAQAYASWNLAQNLHSLRVYDVGQVTDFGIRFDIENRKVGFFDDLAQENQAFIMNANNIRWLEIGFLPYHDNSPYASPIAISPHGFSVTVSPNFFSVNPIYALDGSPVSQLLVHDDRVLNILVPESLRSYEDEIIRLYLDEFYFSQVVIDNIYREGLGLPMNETSMEELHINLIYVQNNQPYFTFDSEVNPHAGNYVYDPIAIVFTGSLGASRLSISVRGGLFFYTDAIDPHAAIAPLLAEHNLSHVIRGTNSIFNENSQSLIDLRNQTMRMTGFIVILIVSSFNVSFALASSYFEKNKLKIFIQSIFGEPSFRRNISFGALNTLLVTVCAVAVALLFEWGAGFSVWRSVVALGFGIIFIDTMFLILLDRKLKSQTLSKQLKGEN